MSYSINVVASSKLAARIAIADRIKDVAATQAVHHIDHDAVVANAQHALQLLADDPTRDVALHCNGYLQIGEGQVQTVCINVSASLVTRK